MADVSALSLLEKLLYPPSTGTRKRVMENFLKDAGQQGDFVQCYFPFFQEPGNVTCNYRDGMVFGGMDGMWTVKIHSTLNTEVRYNYFMLKLSHVWLCCGCGS